jgi:hypothetical protein
VSLPKGGEAVHKPTVYLESKGLDGKRVFKAELPPEEQTRPENWRVTQNFRAQHGTLSDHPNIGKLLGDGWIQNLARHNTPPSPRIKLIRYRDGCVRECYDGGSGLRWTHTGSAGDIMAFTIQ